MKLFTEIGLEPVRGNGVEEKNKRKRILQAVELAEKESGKPAAEKGTPSASQDEAEDGKELEQDQLDALYSECPCPRNSTYANKPDPQRKRNHLTTMPPRQSRQKLSEWSSGPIRNKRYTGF